MDDIARRAGVGSGTLYRHFPTRDASILALVADDLERLATLADELRAGDAPTPSSAGSPSSSSTTGPIAGWPSRSSPPPGSQPRSAQPATESTPPAKRWSLEAQRTGTVRADITPGDAIDLAAAVAWITQNDPDGRRSKLLLHVAIDGLHSPSSRPATHR